MATHGDGTVRGWSVSDGREVYRLKSGYLHTYAASRDGRHVAFPLDGGGVGVLDTRTWKMERLAPVHQDGISTLTFDPRGRHLVSVGGDGKVVVRKLGDAKSVRILSKEGGQAAHAAFTRDGAQLIVTSYRESGGKVLIFGSKP